MVGRRLGCLIKIILSRVFLKLKQYYFKKLKKIKLDFNQVVLIE